MNIQTNTDNHITGREALVAQAEATITGVLAQPYTLAIPC